MTLIAILKIGVAKSMGMNLVTRVDAGNFAPRQNDDAMIFSLYSKIIAKLMY